MARAHLQVRVSSIVRFARFAVWTMATILLMPRAASAQLGQLVSPGPLARAHASVEGAASCQKCHEPGRKVTAPLCLQCHKPVADRIQQRTGVHRDVTDDCTGCHVEHQGVDGELRPFDLEKFNHTRETAFPLTGRHAAIAKNCASCHKTRSFLKVQAACRSCHTDTHKGRLGTDCARCHPTNMPFADAKAHFNHSATTFPLAGAHRLVPCAKCHVAQKYKGLPHAQCTDCHTSPHRAAVGAACLGCHTQDSWRSQKVDHTKTGFPLRGAHASVPCAKCHVKPATKVAIKGDRCATCHTDPHRASFTQDCSGCHTESSFKGGRFDHASTRFSLTGKHANLACSACHKNVPPQGIGRAGRTIDFRGLQTACAACHKDPHGGELGATCESCHTATGFAVTAFNHPRFPEFFGGGHAPVACATCHVPAAPRPGGSGGAPSVARYKGVSTACASCHTDPHLGQVGPDCARCHAIGTPKFAVTGFDHDKTAFPLTGKHQTVACRICHRSETATFPSGTGRAIRLKGLNSACASCHTDVHLGQLSSTCSNCHTTDTFTLPAYVHPQALASLMVGAHATTRCSACHISETGQFPAGRGTAVRFKTGQACENCHADRHEGQMGKACASCHSPASWRVVSRGFHKSGVFPLEGRHLAVDCAQCHWNNTYKGTPNTCYACHWTRRQDDRYQTRLGSDCGRCHRPTGWAAVNWNHATFTGVQLSPVHRMLGCDGCHKNQVFTRGGVSCFGCHEEDYRKAKVPNHVTAGFPTACETCHRASHNSWSQTTFNHAALYPLVAVHATQACSACHKNNVYRGTPRDCVGCHRANYDRTTNPNHVAAGFPTACESCHRATDTSWRTTFNHAAVYPLVGVHATQACSACHKNNVYRGTPRDCVGCHRANYDRTTNPNHAAAGFPTTCESCHSASAATWTSSFNHSAFYPLLGRHLSAPCSRCHQNNVYRGTPRDCVGCHRANYDRTTNPNHAAAGFPTTCESCHSASAATWTSSFNHSAFYPLLGRHLSAPCSRCHQNNVYRGTPRECYPCHRANYERTTNPNHIAAGFPTGCEACHKASDTAWSQGKFNHTWFPITSGKHAGRQCAECHQNPSNYKVFQCTTACHPQSKMDSEHRGRAGYRYDSAACYSCHPTGRAD